MKLNCKPGELCVIIGGSIPSLLGKIVKTVRLDPDFPQPDYLPSWELEEKIFDPMDGLQVSPCDRVMRPLRPRTGNDETLTWAGKPEQVTA